MKLLLPLLVLTLILAGCSSGDVSERDAENFSNGKVDQLQGGDDPR